ncbi:aldehyde oxidase GLOX isoform X2 [Hevea brasiliensis]|uniref:aldehyde oxidase GLOX isoform X2 n=1 Tax=Hevea brasiliensis TaxID=3981 RepID=UPI0025E6DB9D|nr:aldehyde oxidase GLOX isoform X2 [Hevea brasiliensis]
MTFNKTELLLLSFFFTLHSPAISWTTPSYAGRQGEWCLLQSNIGITAMHMQLLHDDKVVIFDRTDFGKSNISLPGGRCRNDNKDMALGVDCTAHSILYDIATNSYRALMVQTDTWCSSGAVVSNGTLVQTGGYNDGDHVIRTFTPCFNEICDWTEFKNYLSQRRWYASDHILPDGRIIIVGGRRQFNYEFYPSLSGTFKLKFLRETYDHRDENNLYPFLHLLPDGNLFIFANTRSILLDYNQNRVIREFPRIPDDVPRNYPSTGSSVLLPLDENNGRIEAEVLICGGARRGSFQRAARGHFLPATSTCGRLVITDQNPSWVMETMPTSRVMSDMLLLPTGDVIIINGGRSGTAGYDSGRDPVTTPVIYRPSEHPDWRFSTMSPSSTPRMYHSSAILLTDGRVLVGGSNPHPAYSFTGVVFPTDLSLEAFSPPYLSEEYTSIRPRILSLDQTLGYGKKFSRMVVLRIISITHESSDMHTLSAVGPSTAEIAPAGYYLLFVLHGDIPSTGAWVKTG